MTSCADNFDRNFEVGRPDKLEQYGYLNDYAALKDYIDQAKYPNFKLGVGTDAADYAKQGVSYVVYNTNFTETVAGNAMKMASCVDDNGRMDFGTVEDYVSAATKAGLSVYGHTLAWHAQQPLKWLNAQIADKVDPDYVPEMEWKVESYPRTCIKVMATEKVDQPWDNQFWIVVDESNAFNTGDSWELSMNVRADKEASIGTQTHKSPGAYIHWAGIGTVPFTPEWKEYKASGNFTGEQNGGYSFAFNLNDFAEENNYYFDDISFKVNGKELIKNGDLSDPNDNSCFATKENRGATVPSRIVDKVEIGKWVPKPTIIEKVYPRTCIYVPATEKVSQPWDNQFWIVVSESDAFKTGDSWELSMNVRADKDASIGTQTHKSPGAYIHWAGIGTVPFTSEWKEYKSSGTFTSEQNGGYSFAFNLNDFADANNYYFDDISFKVNGKELIKNGSCDDPNGNANFATKIANGATLPSTLVDHYSEFFESAGYIAQTDEEKKDTLTKAMEQWISGMMNACKDDNGEMLVKAWDVVNEPISGGGADPSNPEDERKYDLQHGTEDNKTDFFWQDYLGDIDYVRTAVRLARQYGGQDLKLFVNDYNLESDWDQNGKLKSLIKWIERWEADGVTKIDGIGSQMHVSCYLDPQTQESKKNAIVESFKLMAATGKLVRISELDMGLVDEFGKDVATADVTEEQHHAMADLYKFIVAKYLEIIPANQQWGICQWCATDSPANSGWRANSPVGLWDLNYYRKHTYAGFADGLSGK